MTSNISELPSPNRQGHAEIFEGLKCLFGTKMSGWIEGKLIAALEVEESSISAVQSVIDDMTSIALLSRESLVFDAETFCRTALVETRDRVCLIHPDVFKKTIQGMYRGNCKDYRLMPIDHYGIDDIGIPVWRNTITGLFFMETNLAVCKSVPVSVSVERDFDFVDFDAIDELAQ